VSSHAIDFGSRREMFHFSTLTDNASREASSITQYQFACSLAEQRKEKATANYMHCIKNNNKMQCANATSDI